jgi:hypothetical protein
MKPIPNTENPLVIRTDFSDQSAWEAIRKLIQKPVGIFRFRAYVEFLDDPIYEGIDKAQLLTLLPKDYNHAFIVVADRTATSLPDYPLLVVDLVEESGNEFRTIPAGVQAIQNNLSIGNMDFEEFAEAADENGVFRGFPRE